MNFGYHDRTIVSARDRDTYLAAAIEFARAAGAVILPHFRNNPAVTNKRSDGFDPVTVADNAAEAVIRAGIEARFPNHGIFGEELGHQVGRGSHVGDRSDRRHARVHDRHAALGCIDRVVRRCGTGARRDVSAVHR